MKRSMVVVSLLLAAVLLVAAPSAARAEGYLSIQWADRPVCVLLADCFQQWRVRARYQAEWVPPWTWAPTLYTDGDVLISPSHSEFLHVEPLHGWFGAGIAFTFGDVLLKIGGTSGHYFGGEHLFPSSDGMATTDPARQIYNYVEVRFGGRH